MKYYLKMVEIKNIFYDLHIESYSRVQIFMFCDCDYNVYTSYST